MSPQRSRNSTWRSATRDEIHHYYTQEFPEYVDRLPDWITPGGPKEFAVAFPQLWPCVEYDNNSQGETATDFIRRATRQGRDQTFKSWSEVCDFFAWPAHQDPLRDLYRDFNGEVSDRMKLNPPLADPATVDRQQPVAEAVYYKLDHFERSWVLMFDLDAKDFALDRVANGEMPGSDAEAVQAVREKSGITEAPPAGYPYSYEDIERAIDGAFRLEEWLRHQLNFTETQVVYTGQGGHVYALDDDPAHRYSRPARRALMPLIERNLELPIDTNVTPDKARVARLPYSLHAEVSRMVTPIESPDFDFRQTPLPQFLE